MLLLYRLALALYALLLRLVAPFHHKAKLFVAGRKGLLQNIAQRLRGEQRPRIWFHCSSLGEFEQGRPLLEALRERYPGYAIVLTFFSPSGYEVRKDYEQADYVFYLPLDSQSNARCFLDLVKPSLAVFVKYDLWYYYLSGLRERNVETLLISAAFRAGQSYFKWYGSIRRQMLQMVSRIFVQDAGSAQLLESIGIAGNVWIAGDTRFDRVIAAAGNRKRIPELELPEYKLLVAGSTWPDDEVFLQRVATQLPTGWKLIIVPHEVHDSHITDIERMFPAQSMRWRNISSGNLKEHKVLIVDCVGLLLHIYGHAAVAWIGGGFGKDGVHNVLEAAVYGVPCAYGPVFHQFREAEELIACGGAASFANPESFAKWLKELDADNVWYDKIAQRAQQYVHAHGGATQVILDQVRL